MIRAASSEALSRGKEGTGPRKKFIFILSRIKPLFIAARGFSSGKTRCTLKIIPHIRTCRLKCLRVNSYNIRTY